MTYQALIHDGCYVPCAPGTYMDTSPEEATEALWAAQNDAVLPLRERLVERSLSGSHSIGDALCLLALAGLLAVWGSA